MRDLGTRSMMRLTINDATDCPRFRNLRRRQVNKKMTRKFATNEKDAWVPYKIPTTAMSYSNS